MRIRRPFTMLVAALTLAALIASAAAATAVARPAAAHAVAYRNPVLDHDFPDPTVIRARDGWYYGYATEYVTPNAHVNIQVARSRDLVHWRYLGDALPRLPAWGDETGVSWAPHVVAYRGRYLLYYAIVPDRLASDFGLCLAVATSRSPRGPFHTTPSPLYCGPTLADIDPDVFHDPRSGRWYLFWGSGGDIVGRRMRPSLLRLDESAPATLLRGWSSPVRRPYEHGIENPFVVEHDGWYFLFYSGDNCCSWPPHYATMVARARSPLGPYTRIGDALHRRSSVILHSNRRWAGPGGESVVADAAGHDWLAYHAIDRRHPFLPGGGVRRPMLLDRIVYRDGWPRIRGDSPSIWRHRGPVTRPRARR